jgi:origin recognition complex subunit 2
MPPKRKRATDPALSKKGISATPSLPPPGTPSRRTVALQATADPKPSPRKSAFKTPRLETPRRLDRVRFTKGTVSPPPVVTNADRSARRKSVRAIIARENETDDEEDYDEEEEDELARRIYASDVSSDSESREDEGESKSNSVKTKIKAKPGRRAKRVKREFTPPPNTLEGPDSYFHQTRKTRQQTSTHTLSSLPQLDHGKYFSLIQSHAEDHAKEKKLLHHLHVSSFPQWVFELSQGFNLLLYGYGSKRRLLTQFAERLYTGPGSVVVVNGYLPTLQIKEILTTVASALLGAEGDDSLRLGAGPQEILDSLLALLDEPTAGRVHLVVHNIDGESLRNDRAQGTLAHLAAHKNVCLVASVDHIRAPLMWDAARMSLFNFLWHDATTFKSYSVEVSVDDVLALTDGGGRVGGTRGVRYVLASLPTNARSLFRILVGMQVEGMKEKGKEKGVVEEGVEYRVLYQRAVGEFVCSNEVAFRTLLKE